MSATARSAPVSWLQSSSVDRAVCGTLLTLLAIVAVWNAVTYPPVGGFDAGEHIAYVDELVENHALPETGAFYTPPGFYLLAAVAIELAGPLDLEYEQRPAQLLNAALLVGTALLLLALARLLFPGRHVVHWAALAFFVSCPVVLKTFAMFHPQPLVTFLSTLASVLTARMIVRQSYGLGSWIALAVALAAGQLVRSAAIWTASAVLVALVAAAVAQPESRRRIRNALGLAVAAVVLLPLPWYIHLQLTTDSAVFGRAPSTDRWPAAFYVSPGLPDVITEPHRGSLPPRFFPVLYADTWGDYFGIWSWGAPRPDRTPEVNRRLVVQSVIGLPATILAGAGWLALLGLSLRGAWRTDPARVLVAAMPLAGLAAVLFYTTRNPTGDGDTIKAMFLLPAVPLWALSFGFACDTLLRGNRRVALPVFAVLAACAVVSLAFATFALVS